MIKRSFSLFLSINLLSQGIAFANEAIKAEDLGTLTNNYGYSTAIGVSADGHVIVGWSSSDGGNQQAFRYSDGQMIGLGTLKSDNSGFSITSAISANGDVIVGNAETDNGYIQAFRYSGGQMIELGTLRDDNLGFSEAIGVSADGHVIVGNADTNDGYTQAFRYSGGLIIGLGTLTADNSGYSAATGVSADGQVIVGNAQTDDGYTQAFRYSGGQITGVGTLTADNSGTSTAIAVSANGQVIVGTADTDNGYIQAFRYSDGQIIGLGALTSGNFGFSEATGVSADGQVIVGNADTDNGYIQAFRYSGSQMIGLGTLKSDNSGSSKATAVSADGQVIVGEAENDNGYNIQAFRYSGGQMVGLGTLKSDNSGSSKATAVSADGHVIVGEAENDLYETRAVVWKTTKAVDINNTYAGMSKTASKASSALDLYQNSLQTLTDSRCQIGEDNYCLGVYSQHNKVRQNKNLAGGLYGAIRLPAEGWIIGGSFNLVNNADLVKNYSAHSNTFPGIGLFTRYQANKDNSGFNIELAGSYIKQNLSISREKLMGSEAGKGNSTIKGYLGKVTAGYGINVSPDTQLTPLIAVQHYKVSRDSYTENRNADFLVHYSELSNKNTDLQLGLNLKQKLSTTVSLDAEVGNYINLKSERNAFKAHEDYFGTQNYQRMKSQHTKPYARLGTHLAVAKNSTISANLSWSKTDYRKEASYISVGYSYHW